MTETEIAAWQLNDVFAPRIVAALIIGVNPHEVNDGQISPILERMCRDYASAIYLHMQDIANLYEGVETSSDAKALLGKSLQSIAMVLIVDPADGWKLYRDPLRGQPYDPQQEEVSYYEPEEVNLWLSHVWEDPQPWKCSNFEVQEFSRNEIVRWLKGNNISSVFPFDRESQSVVAAEESRFIKSGRTPHRTTLMDAVEEASARYWGELVSVDDHDTHPTNAKVAEWLVENELVGKTMADKIATIIRPPWAHKGKPPEH